MLAKKKKKSVSQLKSGRIDTILDGRGNSIVGMMAMG